jgi:adenosylhomocysteine nucleosidase
MPPCDLLIFVATQTEFEQLQRVATEMGLPWKEGESPLGTFYNLGAVGTNRVLVVRTAMGPLTYKGSASHAIYYLNATEASGVIGLGMAFGVDRTTQSVGDVLVATGIVPYDNNRRVFVETNGQTAVDYSRIKKFPSKPSLLELFQRKAKLPDGVDLHPGLLLSGGARIHSAAYRDELVRMGMAKGGPVVGGDMEGVGFLSTSDRANPRWIVVKAICDFADERRDEEIEATRLTACYNAAKFVLATLREA